MKRRMLVISGILFLFALGAGAMVLTAGLLDAPAVAAQETAQEPRPDVAIIAVEQIINGERIAGEVEVTFVNPAGLPQGAPAQRGVFVNLYGSTLTLGTGRIDVEVGVDQINDEEPVVNTVLSFSGPEVAVQLTAATQFVSMSAEQPQITAAVIEAGAMTVQREATPGSITALSGNMIIRVWGSFENGVLVADTVAYEIPR